MVSRVSASMLGAESVPVIVKLSSTVTVPPAESIVKFPDVVSISFPSMRTLSIVELPLTSKTPSTVVASKVVVPVTFKLSLTSTVPLAESKFKLPEFALTSFPFIWTLSTVATPVTFIYPTIVVLSKFVSPSTSKFPLRSAAPATVSVPSHTFGYISGVGYFPMTNNITNN